MKKIKYLSAVLLLFGLCYHVNAQEIEWTTQQDKMVTISSFTAKGNLEKLKIELYEGLNHGLTVNEIKEMIVHTYAYCGFPRAIRGLQTLMIVLDERKEKGIIDEWGREASSINDKRDKYERGKDILAELTGVKVIGRPQEGYAAFAPEIETFLKEHLFADIFERDVLTYAQREIVTTSVIASIGGAEPMLYSHLNLSLNIGITPQQLQQLILTIKDEVSEEDGVKAQSVLLEVIKNRKLK